MYNKQKKIHEENKQKTIKVRYRTKTCKNINKNVNTCSQLPSMVARTLETEEGRYLFQGQPGLQNKYQDRINHMENPCLNTPHQKISPQNFDNASHTSKMWSSKSCKPVQPVWKSILQFIGKMIINIFQDPAILLLVQSQMMLNPNKDTSLCMFTATLNNIHNIYALEPSRYLLRDKQKENMVYLFTQVKLFTWKKINYKIGRVTHPGTKPTFSSMTSLEPCNTAFYSVEGT